MMTILQAIVFSMAFVVGEVEAVQRFYNGRIIRNHELVNDELWVSEGRIVSPQGHADESIDLQGLIVAPGYIDLQINGGFGIDFTSNPKEVDDVAGLLPQYGVTSFLPTVISSSPEHYHKVLPLLLPSKTEGVAHNLGIHLEGPFFNAHKYGAHDASLICSFDQTSLEKCYGSLDEVKIVTLAPEISGAHNAIAHLRAKGIIISAGHSNATYEEMIEATRQGVSMVTHLFNAMSSFHHREPGIVGVALTENLYYSVIADGVHTHPAVVKMAWEANSEGFFLVTDAMEAVGLPKGIYSLGNRQVEVDNGVAYIKGTKTIAGSVLTMDKAVRNFRAWSGCSLVEAVEAASYVPARVLGIEDKKGSLHVGADADFILLDDELDVRACYIDGRIIASSRE